MKYFFVILLFTLSCSADVLPTAVEPDVSENNDMKNNGASSDSDSPNPHWVLRDKDGEAIKAWVIPQRAYDADLILPKPSEKILFGEKHEAHDCFGIQQTNEKSMLFYSLTSGTLSEKCQRESSFHYSNPFCTVAVLGALNSVRIKYADGIAHFGKDRVPDGTRIYKLNPTTNECDLIETTVPTSTFYSIEEVPDRIVGAYVEHAPLTLEIEF